MPEIDPNIVRRIVKAALSEDIGQGDITTEGFVPESAEARGEFIACAPCIVAGIPVVQAVFEELDSLVKVTPYVIDGESVAADGVIAEISGPVRPILTGERVALNFLQRLSGIATLTAKFVEKARKYGVEIKDTRKTTPGLRYLEKYAVRVGGGSNHRMGLHDAVMIKDNHLKLIEKNSGDMTPEASVGDRVPRILAEFIRQFRESNPQKPIEIEAETIEQVKHALSAGADIIMLDNMPNHQMKKAVKLVWNSGDMTPKARVADRVPRAEHVIIEASGGVTLDNVAEIAATGVDWISVGALTSSAPPIDIKLELSP